MFDFSGGLNTTLTPNMIANNELSLADNVFIEGSKIVKKKGTQWLGAAPDSGNAISGLYNYSQYDGDDRLMASTNGAVYYWVTSTSAWSKIYGTFTTAHNIEYQSYLDKAFIANGINPVQSWDGDAAVSALAVSPDHATETFTAAAHGLLDDDRVRFTATALPTGISGTTTYFVVNKAANTFQVSETSGGGAKAYTSNGTTVKVSEYMHQHSDIPVSSATSSDIPHYLESFKSRLIMANTDNYPYRVYYTDEGASTVGTNNYFDIKQPITGIKIFRDILYVFTLNTIYRVDGFIFSGDGTEPEKIYNVNVGAGAVSDRSVSIINNVIYFLGPDDVYAFDGSNIYPLAKPKIKDTFEKMNITQFENACSGVRDHKYYLSIPNEVDLTVTATVWGTAVWGTDNWGYTLSEEGLKIYPRTLVYDTVRKVWTVDTIIDANAYANVYKDSIEKLYYGGSENVAEVNVGYSSCKNNLILNSSFEDGTVAATPTNWTEVVDAGTGTANKEDENASLGSHSLEVDKSTGASLVNAYQDFTATAAKKYQFSGFVKTTYTGSAGDIYFQILLAASPNTVYGKIEVGDKDNRAGRYYFMEVSIPTGVTAVRVSCLNGTTGDSTVYFDDIRFCEYDNVITTNDGLIPMDVHTKARCYNKPDKSKKFKETLLAANSNSNYDLKDQDYNLTLGYASGLFDDFTEISIDMNETDDHIEKYVKTPLKSKYIRYQLKNHEPLEPVEIYGISTEFIPKRSFK